MIGVSLLKFSPVQFFVFSFLCMCKKCALNESCVIDSVNATISQHAKKKWMIESSNQVEIILHTVYYQGLHWFAKVRKITDPDNVHSIPLIVKILIFGVFCCHLFLRLVQCYVEKLAEEPEEAVKKPVVVANVNKWEGEDEDDVKVSLDHSYVEWCLIY